MKKLLSEHIYRCSNGNLFACSGRFKDLYNQNGSITSQMRNTDLGKPILYMKGVWSVKKCTVQFSFMESLSHFSEVVQLNEVQWS